MAQYAGKKIKADEMFTSIFVDFPVYNLDQYRKTGDNNWFLKGYDGRQKKINTDALKATEMRIMEEYYIASDDRSFQLTLQTFAKINDLQTKYICVLDVINAMTNGFAPDLESQNIRAAFIEVLKGWGFPMNIMATPLEDFERLKEINDSLPGIRTQIKMLQDEIKKKEKGVSQSLRKQLKIVQLALGSKSDYDPKTLIVGDWLEDIKLMEEISAKN